MMLAYSDQRLSKMLISLRNRNFLYVEFGSLLIAR